MLQFFKMQLFRASLPGDLRKAVAQHDQTTITLDDMYQVATDTQRGSGLKDSKPVFAIQDDSQSEDEDEEDTKDEVAAFQNKLLEQNFKRHPTTKFNKTPSANYILL